jgi:hypothetical protein
MDLTKQAGPVWAAAFMVATVMGSAVGGQAVPPSLDRLGWLAGCWEQSQGRRIVHEQWMSPLGSSMLGMSRTVAEGRTVAHEFMRIEARDGSLVFVAAPSGQREASFHAVEQAGDMIGFSNPEHDFPQRIRYRRQPDGSVLGQIEGDDGGKVRVIEYPMRRVPCPGDAAPKLP